MRPSNNRSASHSILLYEFGPFAFFQVMEKPPRTLGLERITHYLDRKTFRYFDDNIENNRDDMNMLMAIEMRCADSAIKNLFGLGKKLSSDCIPQLLSPRDFLQQLAGARRQ